LNESNYKCVDLIEKSAMTEMRPKSITSFLSVKLS